MPINYVLLPDRNLPVSLPNGQTLLIGYTENIIGLNWFEGSLKTEPVRSKRVPTAEWEGIYTRYGWNLVMVLELVLTEIGADKRP